MSISISSNVGAPISFASHINIPQASVPKQAPTSVQTSVSTEYRLTNADTGPRMDILGNNSLSAPLFRRTMSFLFAPRDLLCLSNTCRKYREQVYSKEASKVWRQFLLTEDYDAGYKIIREQDWGVSFPDEMDAKTCADLPARFYQRAISKAQTSTPELKEIMKALLATEQYPYVVLSMRTNHDGNNLFQIGGISFFVFEPGSIERPRRAKVILAATPDSSEESTIVDRAIEEDDMEYRYYGPSSYDEKPVLLGHVLNEGVLSGSWLSLKVKEDDQPFRITLFEGFSLVKGETSKKILNVSLSKKRKGIHWSNPQVLLDKEFEVIKHYKVDNTIKTFVLSIINGNNSIKLDTSAI